MQSILINLDDQAERFASVEKNFLRTCTDDWFLHRLSAVNKTQVADVDGRLSPAEKGCFLSHILAIQASQAMAGHTLILEDDVLFGDQSFRAIDTALSIASRLDWDVLFTDVCVPDPAAMLRLFNLHQKLARESDIRLLALDQIVFAGSTAYLVNARSKKKLVALLTQSDRLDLPYDLTLRQCVQNKRINGFFVFPFATSLSRFANQSQIQQQGASHVADVCWNAFRRLVWLGGSAQSAIAEMSRIADEYCDPECTAFSKILTCTLSKAFVAK